MVRIVCWGILYHNNHTKSYQGLSRDVDTDCSDAHTPPSVNAQTPKKTRADCEGPALKREPPGSCAATL